MTNIVSREEPVLFIAEIQQGENKVGVKAAVTLQWSSMSSEERKQYVEETARAALENLLGELTYE